MSAARQAHELIHRYLIEEAQASDVAELDQLLLHDAEVADAFVEAAWFDALLQAAHTRRSQLSGIELLAAKEHSVIDPDAQPHLRSETLRGPVPVPVPPMAAVSSPLGYPVIALADHSVFGAAGDSFSGWPVAYLVATVVFGVGLIVGALVHVSQPVQHVQSTPTFTTPSARDSSVVGLITATVDCQWENQPGWVKRNAAAPRTGHFDENGFGTDGRGSLVHLGDKFTLSSGLMEITYDTGAKVILQGSVAYEVESRDGGYLSVGKLTAKLEQKSEVRGQRSESANQRSEITNQKFAVRTPTAIVTDLGTEFGVEVDKHGRTSSHVFRGSVRVQKLAVDGAVQGTAQILNENESMHISNDNTDAMVVRDGAPASFVRAIPRQRQTTKTLDLVDVVAGGDGFSGKRGRGIDPSNGQVRTADAPPPQTPIVGDGKYHRVKKLPFVDGVFVPHNNGSPMQLDSAGHTFADFPATDNKTSGYIWTADGNRAGALTPQADSLKQLDSLAFTWKYEMNVAPNTDNQNGVAGGDFRFHDVDSSPTAPVRFNGAVNGDGTITMPVGNVQFKSDKGNATHVWNSITFTGGYTIETRLKAAQTGPDASIGLLGGTASGAVSSLLVADDGLHWGIRSVATPFIPLDDNTNADAFHVFRIVQFPNANTFAVWRDGILLGDSLPSASELNVPSLVVGSVTASDAGANQIDYLRITSGAFAPIVKRATTVHASNALDDISRAMQGHAVLEMHANKGVTFDLQAIRQANPGCKLIRFSAMAGNAEHLPQTGGRALADVWVFVDGQVRFRRREINRYNGVMPVIVPIRDNDRFLTLAGTDGGNGYGEDQIIFGDPRLEMLSPQPQK